MRQVARETGHETAAEARYRRLFAERREGESWAAFASRVGVAPGTLSSWRHELRCRDAARERRSAEGGGGPALLPVRVVAAREQGRPSASAHGYEVVLAGGRRVLRVPAGFEAAEVRALVAAVEGAPC
jgi:transposase-like protein